MHTVEPGEGSTDLRIIFTDMFHQGTMKMINDADRAALFRDMSAKDQVACVQSGILGGLSIYLAAITPTKELFGKLKQVIAEAMPHIMDAAERQVDTVRANNGFPPKPDK